MKTVGPKRLRRGMSRYWFLLWERLGEALKPEESHLSQPKRMTERQVREALNHLAGIETSQHKESA